VAGERALERKSVGFVRRESDVRRGAARPVLLEAGSIARSVQRRIRRKNPRSASGMKQARRVLGEARRREGLQTLRTERGWESGFSHRVRK